ncbi:phosphate ABC transporter permease PstA [Halococcoides cellulosivorans]|uniref:Phosphate transport system permease protein PstA n=1 Tax=Halococcoides cellulosivorans TaxID=1679096 RepID=A0A2R4WZD3_9EURY|nr:phosphate ABC transporter permease PstA [Halococcoides cellulosivorans]AWB26897.1 phosphate ABC transporter permease PtsA [Halococcoides cellulosivorans]
MAAADWYGDSTQVSQTRGRMFEALCLGATSVGLVSVLVLLLYVANDAFAPLTADPGWHLVYFVTLAVPTLAVSAYLYRSESRAGEVAYTTTGLPVVGLLVAGGLLVVFAEVFPVREWFALVVAVAVTGALLAGHARVRPSASLERAIGGAIATVVIVFGTPPVAIARLLGPDPTQIALPGVSVTVPGLTLRLASLPELILSAPYLPIEPLQIIATLTLPIAALGGWYLGRSRESRREGLIAGVGLLAGAVAPAVLAIPTGTDPTIWLVAATTTVVPMGVYVEGVVRRRSGLAGLWIPVALVAGAVTGTAITAVLGLAGPETWLDWQFLTNAPSTTAAEAGIYPALVGSVMLLIVVIVATFPVGVGAAIYLEEYAPSNGLAGTVVTLIEINIANLAGVPSVVYGLLGLAVFINWVQFPSGSILVGGLTVGLLILPIVVIAAQEAIEAVPDSTRQAAYGMGATRWQTVRTVVLPKAMPGILTGTILALGRAIGETAPLLLVGIAASVRMAPNGVFDLGSAMPRQIFTWAFEPAEEFRYGVLAAGVVTLLVVLLVMNATAIVLRHKFD